MLSYPEINISHLKRVAAIVDKGEGGRQQRRVQGVGPGRVHQALGLGHTDTCEVSRIIISIGEIPHFYTEIDFVMSGIARVQVYCYAARLDRSLKRPSPRA
jgi:hypothetical protein